MRRLLAVAGWMGAITAAAPGLALDKVVRIESTPPDAEVYLLQGARETLIGRTPFDYQADFHSEMSVLRLAFKKPGFESRRVELAATQSELRASLEARGLVAVPASSMDEALAAIQSQLRPSLEPILSRFLSGQSSSRFDLARPAAATGRSGAARLEIVLDMQKPEGQQSKPSAQEAEASARLVWQAIAGDLALPVSRQVVAREPRLSGLLVEVRYADVQTRFAVGTRTETRMESRCQPGMVMTPVFNPCLRHEVTTYQGRTESRCISGMENQMRHNPCATRIMVPVTETKLDPTVQVASGTLVFRFYLPRDASAAYEKLAVLVRSGAQEVLMSRGAMPD